MTGEVPGARAAPDVFVTRAGRPKLVECAVLFVDILGVRAMNRSSAAREHLIALERAVSESYRDFLSPLSPWPAAFFSDTLVLASPTGEQDAATATGGLIVQAALLQRALIAQGYFLRGGLTVGRFYIRNGFVFGPALADAYELESRQAIYPRIVLDETARSTQRATATGPAGPSAGLLLDDPDGWTFVNYLGLAFDETDPARELRIHRDRISAELAAHRRDKRVWEKYRWVAEYHNTIVREAIERRVIADAGEHRIPGEDITWRFEAFDPHEG